MRRSLAVVALLVAMSFSSPALANVVFNVTASVDNGRTLNTVVPGDIVTLDIRLTNDSPADYIAALGGAVMGYSPSSIQFVDGQSADTSLFCTTPACTNGIVSILDSTTPLVEQFSPVTGPYVTFVSGVSTIYRNGDGSLDPGIDGIVGGGDAEFRVRFRYLGGLATFDIGTTTDTQIGIVIVVSTASVGGTARTVQGVNAHLVFPVPEPGTAVLAGLGLAGLASTKKRRSQRCAEWDAVHPR